MTFLIRWKHKDGSLVEFSDHGWRSDDPKKNEWLIKINELCSTSPLIAPIIRIWLQETCQLAESKGPQGAPNPAGVPDNPCIVTQTRSARRVAVIALERRTARALREE
jgi:hypothetical protein